jgi:hypothetical protein
MVAEGRLDLEAWGRTRGRKQQGRSWRGGVEDRKEVT